MTDKEKCAELLAIVKEVQGEGHDIPYFLASMFSVNEEITFKEFVDELIREARDYERSLWS